MDAVDEVDQLIERFHQVQGEFVKGNPEPVKQLWSHAEDVTLNNPLSPPALGWDEVAKRMADVASGRREGEFSSEIVEKYVTPELACVVEMEHGKAKFGVSEDETSYALRATILFRREEGTWKVAHRHADPLSTVQSVASYEVE